MKLSNSYFFTLRENPKDEDSLSGNLLVRSSMIKKSSSGIYMYLPLGYKVFKNVENIIREEMDNINSQELIMPSLITSETYEKSGRKENFGSSIFTLKDRFDRSYCLGPTHEELFVIASSMKLKSYKDLPLSLYQIQRKYRDEARPRFGLIRIREFTMKDSYTFDKDEEGLNKSYEAMYKAYEKIFKRLNIDYKVVIADSGVMGGSLSEEWQALTDIGEDTVVICRSCSYSSNVEVSKCINNNVSKEEYLEKELVETKDAKTIEEVSKFFNEDKSKFVKTLIYKIDNEFYALLINGEDELNELKVLKFLNKKNIELASFEDVEKVTNSKVGFAGPINLNIKIIIDDKVSKMRNFIVGANKTDYHYKNVNIKDFEYVISDIRNVKENDICPRCMSNLYFRKGIEVGNTFKLGTKYSESMGLNFVDSDNKIKPVYMGSYGIGVDRCIAAIVEQSNDEKGIIWPYDIAPYKVCIVIANVKDDIQSQLANKVYNELKSNNIEVILDDRNETLGIKLNDMDLIGIPIRILVGKKSNEDIVELKYRNKEEVIEINIKDILNYIKK